MTAAPTETTPSLFHRPSDLRGHSDHEWLRSFHTFSFGAYYTEEPREQHWGSLRVINEDRVSPRNGFPPHSHREFEIFSYIIKGTIKHSDSMGNVELLKRGMLQMTSAGTGIKHSEFNGGVGSEDLHFLQLWAVPSTKGLTPAYYTRTFTDDEKRSKLVKVVAPIGTPSVADTREGTGPTPIHSPLTMYASILPPAATVSHTFPSDTARKGLLQLIMTSGYAAPGAKVNGGKSGAKVSVELEGQKVELEEGDVVYLDGVKGKDLHIKSTGAAEAEFVLIDLAE